MEFCRAGVLAHVTETIHDKFGTMKPLQLSYGKQSYVEAS
jgi:hypothetical protein